MNAHDAVQLCEFPNMQGVSPSTISYFLKTDTKKFNSWKMQTLLAHYNQQINLY